MSEKNIINQAPSSTTNGSANSANTLTEYIFTEVFYANGNAGEDDRSFQYRVYKLGNLVTLIMRQQNLMNVVNVQYWQRSAALPVGLRPPSSVSVTFTPRVGINDFDSDILGTMRIDSGGTISIWRELLPGTGVWNGGVSQGWDTISVSYFV